jgi:hypothetical protein
VESQPDSGGTGTVGSCLGPSVSAALGHASLPLPLNASDERSEAWPSCLLREVMRLQPLSAGTAQATSEVRLMSLLRGAVVSGARLDLLLTPNQCVVEWRHVNSTLFGAVVSVAPVTRVARVTHVAGVVCLLTATPNKWLDHVEWVRRVEWLTHI